MIATAIVALLMSMVLQPVVIGVLRRGDVMDSPNHRSSHTVEIPRGGGVAVLIGVISGLAISTPGWTTSAPLVAAALLFGLIGLIEDTRGLGVRIRLILQMVSGVAVGAALLHDGAVRWMAIPIAAFWVIAYCNAFNFMDGVNGISALNTVVAGTIFAILGIVENELILQIGGVSLVAASVGFLPWNAVRARVFLGDSGSYGLGAYVATLSVVAIAGGVPVVAALGPMALYISDTSWTLARRVRAGEIWHEAHRSHTYQRLTDVGWSHLSVACFAAIVSLLVSLCGLTSLSGEPYSGVVAAAVSAPLLLGYLATPWFLQRV